MENVTFVIDETRCTFNDVIPDVVSLIKSTGYEKHISVREKYPKKPGSHVHVIMKDVDREHIVDWRDFTNRTMIGNNKQGPIRLLKKPVNESFLDYVFKQRNWKKNLVTNTLYSTRELEEAHERSDLYVKAQKEADASKLKEYLLESFPKSGSPNLVWVYLWRRMCHWYVENNKRQNSQMKFMLISLMCEQLPNKEMYDFANKVNGAHFI